MTDILGVPLAKLPPLHRHQAQSWDDAAPVTSSASSNTKGSWIEIDPSIDVDADGFYFWWLAWDGGSMDWLVDIGIGAAGSEQVIVSNLLVSSGNNGFQHGGEVYIPLGLPKGTRVAARCQAGSGSQRLTVAIECVRGRQYAAQRCKRATTYGANTGDSGGTDIDPGGTVDTFGSWVEFSAALTHPVSQLLFAHGNRRDASRAGAYKFFQVGVGAAGSERVVGGLLSMQLDAPGEFIVPTSHQRLVEIPRGERLAVRSSCQINDADNRLTDLVVIGFGP